MNTQESSPRSSVHLSPDAPVEYIVVGSGAGGGPLACNLAKAGYKVVLIEAGDDDPQTDFPADVPSFGGIIADDQRISWGYFVRHYANDEQQRRNPNYDPQKDGVWYPRVGALGGCTMHSIMVQMYPSNTEWDKIAELIKDPSWKGENMRKYFEKLEACRYVERPGNGTGPSRHGFDGWQPSEIPDPSIFDKDENVIATRKTLAEEVGPPDIFDKIRQKQRDPNDWREIDNRQGIYNFPLYISNGKRYGPRQLIRETKAALPNNLIVKTNSLVTKVLFQDKTAIGVEYVTKPRLYRADPNPNPDPNALAVKETLKVTREVLLCAGAFNSPQILMLSGIGAKEELDKHGIPQLVDLPGVGKNLQDRYEITLVTKLKSPYTFSQHCTLFQTPDDPCVADWSNNKGVYTNTGVMNVMLMKSKTAQAQGRHDPDLFIFDAPLPFTGYHEGYSQRFLTERDKHTWAVLKAYTLNNAGTVTLRSKDPRDTPVINFHYFAEGSDTEGEDLASIVDGVEIMRRFNANPHSKEMIIEEECPRKEVYGDSSSREVIAQYVQDQAWGHHASCSNKMGPREDRMAVVDNNFRVHGTRNLRVVDASVFPRIPGYFILTPIYMIAEKATEVIIADAKKQFGRR